MQHTGGLEKLLHDAINAAVRERGHINILIAGRSGVGKSTLINAVFQQNLAETGQGKPVTQNTREITKQGVPVSIFDTRGLEMRAFEQTLSELETLIVQRAQSHDANQHIHAAWLCIQEDGRRVEDAEILLHQMLAKHMPLIAVITKARADQGFRQRVQELLPLARSVVRVRALHEQFDEGMQLEPMGLDTLIEATSEVIPEGKRQALAAAQKAHIAYKRQQAHKIVATAAAAAAAAGATPIPFADAAVLAPIQMGMIAGITAVFGLDLSKAALTTLVTTAIGVGGATLVGRAIVVNVMKLLPGAGSIAGGAVSAATASTLTVALGEAYIAVLSEVLSDNPDARPSALDLARRLKEKLAKGKGKTTDKPNDAAR